MKFSKAYLIATAILARIDFAAATTVYGNNEFVLGSSSDRSSPGPLVRSGHGCGTPDHPRQCWKYCPDGGWCYTKFDVCVDLDNCGLFDCFGPCRS
ncbi:hypothetical protein CPC08DRAFT_818136 [Agrocybe pediades]|nr:hypothetical protein CPC08DRAFT_818136 [Agrocybe pediades]